MKHRNTLITKAMHWSISQHRREQRRDEGRRAAGCSGVGPQHGRHEDVRTALRAVVTHANGLRHMDQETTF